MSYNVIKVTKGGRKMTSKLIINTEELKELKELIELMKKTSTKRKLFLLGYLNGLKF